MTTSYLPDIWERVPGEKAEYGRRKDVIAAPLWGAPDGALDFIPLGTAYITVSNGVYLQWDNLGASTRHYYGPFVADTLKQLRIDLDAVHLPMQ